MSADIQCESCAYLEYDEETEEWLCSADLDEDDFGRIVYGSKGSSACPYYRNGDEYSVVRKQN